MDAHAGEAHDDAVARTDLVHWRGAHGLGGHDDPAVHLRVLDGAPTVIDAHVGRQVGRRVEALGQHAVTVGGHERRVAVMHTIHAVDLQLLEQRIDGAVVGRADLDARAARVDVRAPELELVDVVIRARLDDQIEHLGEQQGVDDVTLELHGLGRHVILSSRYTASLSTLATGTSSAPIVTSGFSLPRRSS